MAGNGAIALATFLNVGQKRYRECGPVDNAAYLSPQRRRERC
ncbi:MAG: hypothetical protein AAF889_05460 [Cyanobacteria bacterium P01_D01_bin.73]